MRDATYVPGWRLPLAAAILVVCAGTAVWCVRSQWTIDRPSVRIPASSVGDREMGDSAPASSVALLAALGLYQSGEYVQAARALEPVAASHPDSAAAAFYLGVSRLLAGEPAAALEPLERAAALTPDGQRAEIDWYRATAERRAGRIGQSRTRLLSLCAQPGDYRDRACAAAKKVW